MLMPTDTVGQAIYTFIFTLVRYLLFGGTAFLIFYIIFKDKPFLKKIQQKWPSNKDYQREIGYSFLTFFIFASIPFILNNHYVRPHTTIYTNIHQHSLLYFTLAFPLLLIIHDTYFYWMHRMMHQPKLFKFFHVVHHKSTNPSPLASFAFQPTEAFIEAGVIIVFAFTVPIHFYHIFFLLFIMTMYNVYGHLGFELYPKNFNKHWLGKWLNTSVNHNMHHQYFKGNYGLYFTFWDRIMNTLHKDYDDHYKAATTKAEIKNNPPKINSTMTEVTY
jgi:Delta7-sterol 5-desaturase